MADCIMGELHPPYLDLNALKPVNGPNIFALRASHRPPPVDNRTAVKGCAITAGKYRPTFMFKSKLLTDLASFDDKVFATMADKRCQFFATVSFNKFLIGSLFIYHIVLAFISYLIF
jgi:hypothetical protein